VDLRETEWEVMDWMHLPQDRDQWRGYVNMVMNFRDPWKAENILTS